jgi:mycoredoxin
MALTLYHVNWCPECEIVRKKLTDLDIAYESVVVPDFRPMRKQVHDVSGQYYVPVLKDGETVLTETREILTYIDQHYGADSRVRRTGSELREDEQNDDGSSCSLTR